MTFGSLFAGIGGMDLGLERAGMTCAWQVEIDPYASRVLAKHWPNVLRHDDVKTFPPTDPKEWHVDLICGGFPCQDISFAGSSQGLQGERSGLWFEYARIIRQIRPSFVLVENVAALLVRGIDAVLGTLASLGYDAEWSSLSACSLGASHMRHRVFIVAYPNSLYGASRLGIFQDRTSQNESGNSQVMSRAWALSVADAARNTHGISSRLECDRRRGIGNAVSPVVAEWIGQRIMKAHQAGATQ